MQILVNAAGHNSTKSIRTTWKQMDAGSSGGQTGYTARTTNQLKHTCQLFT